MNYTCFCATCAFPFSSYFEKLGYPGCEGFPITKWRPNGRRLIARHTLRRGPPLAVAEKADAEWSGFDPVARLAAKTVASGGGEFAWKMYIIYIYYNICIYIYYNMYIYIYIIYSIYIYIYYIYIVYILYSVYIYIIVYIHV